MARGLHTGEGVKGFERELDGIRVLLVEDDPDTREVLTLGLELYGAKVVAVGSASAALDELAKEPPDVLLTDIGLPDEDGLTLIRRVRTLPPAVGGRVPAAAVTAFTLGDDATAPSRAGFQAHFRKPVDTGTLFGAVARLALGGSVDRRETIRRASPPAVADGSGRRSGEERRYPVAS